MNNIIPFLCALLFWLSCTKEQQTNVRSLVNKNIVNSLPDSLQHYISYQSTPLAVTNVTIIDGSGSTASYNQTVLIENGSFKTIGDSDKVKIPASVKIIDLEGKTIIPGLVGMHNHMHMPGVHFLGANAAKLYLAAGVTTMQTCGAASPYKEIETAKQIENGQLIGPDIITSGPYFTGHGGNTNMIIPRDEQHIRDTLRHWIKKGVKWFKVYRNTKPEDLKIIIDEVHKNGGKVTGHLCSITFTEAAKMGIDGIEHGFNSTSDFRGNKTAGICDGSRDYIDDLDMNGSAIKELFQTMIGNNVFLTSTLSIYEASVPNRSFADERSQKVMSPALLQQYRERRARHNAIADLTRERRLKRNMEFDVRYYKMGGLLVSGVDPGRHNLPGFGDQRNFELLIEAELTTPEAIQVMTMNGAIALEKENIGVISVGRKADFIILNGDLEKNPAVIKDIETVFKNGIGYNSKKIIASLNGKIGM